MRIIPLLLVALLFGCSIAVPTARACGPLTARPDVIATGMVRWTWGSPESPTANQDFVGPGIYVQTISVTGLSGTYSQLQFGADVLGEYPAAWSMLFVPPYQNCQGQPAFGAVPVVAGTEVIPGATLDVMTLMPVCWPSTLSLQAAVTFNPPFTFDPSKRYGVATLSFDHSASVVGTADAAHCGGADAGMCFNLYCNVGTVELPALTWQHGACVNPTATRTSTWGALKQTYR
jgi:hypothetical protein